MKTIMLLSIILLKTTCLLSQNDSILKSEIDKRTWSIEKGKRVNKKSIKIDTIDCQISIYKNMNEVKCLFEKSKKQLLISYYHKNNSFDKISIRENSLMPEDFWRLFIFYYKNDKELHVDERLYSSVRMHGIAGRMEDEVYKQYDKNITEDFLRKFILKLNEN